MRPGSTKDATRRTIEEAFFKRIVGGLPQEKRVFLHFFVPNPCPSLSCWAKLYPIIFFFFEAFRQLDVPLTVFDFPFSGFPEVDSLDSSRRSSSFTAATDFPSKRSICAHWPFEGVDERDFFLEPRCQLCSRPPFTNVLIPSFEEASVYCIKRLSLPVPAGPFLEKHLGSPGPCGSSN